VRSEFPENQAVNYSFFPCFMAVMDIDYYPLSQEKSSPRFCLGCFNLNRIEFNKIVNGIRL